MLCRPLCQVCSRIHSKFAAAVIISCVLPTFPPSPTNCCSISSISFALIVLHSGQHRFVRWTIAVLYIILKRSAGLLKQPTTSWARCNRLELAEPPQIPSCVYGTRNILELSYVFVTVYTSMSLRKWNSFQPHCKPTAEALKINAAGENVKRCQQA